MSKKLYLRFLFRITRAAITPGTHPAPVSRNTMRTEPQPLSMTANGGKMMASRTLPNDITLFFFKDNDSA